jgi:hypothetical protein
MTRDANDAQRGDYSLREKSGALFRGDASPGFYGTVAFTISTRQPYNRDKRPYFLYP